MTFWVVVVYILGLVERRKQALHTVLGRNPEEAAVPIVAHMEAAEVVQAVRMAVAEVAVPIVVRTEIEVVQAVRMVVAVVHREAVAAAGPNLAVAAGLDHKTWIIPSCQKCNRF